MNTNIIRKITTKDTKLSYEVLDSLRTAIIILNEKLKYIYINSSAYNILGASHNLPKIKDLVCMDVDLIQYLTTVLENEQPIILRDFKFKNFERLEKIVDCNISVFDIGKGRHLLIELNETDRLYNISIEKSMLDQQKATREMVKGLSHEIKNPLGGIMGAAQLIDKNLNDQSLSKFTRIIKKESERLLMLINSMSSPTTSVEKEFINVHELTDHVVDLFKFDTDSTNIVFIKDYDPSIPKLYLDKNQIIQSLINIVRNAVQAVDGTGKVVIKTRPLLKYTIADVKHDLVIKIDIIDNGIGITEEKIKEIFYPMVTTKNQGMGLGLTIAQSLITQNKGLIECISKNRITTFSIILPWGNK